MRCRGMSVAEYAQILNNRLPLTTLGSTIDQSPVTKTILRISSMLSMSMIPVALFTANSQLKQVPERFVSVFADMKSKPPSPLPTATYTDAPLPQCSMSWDISTM